MSTVASSPRVDAADDGSLAVPESFVLGSDDVETGTASKTVSGDLSDDGLPPVDGFRAWVNVLGSFLAHFGSIAVLYSFSLFVKPYQEQFNATRTEVSVIYMLQVGGLMSFGLFAGTFADRFGVKKVVLGGSLLIASGFFLASFATELWHVILSQGLMVGMGFSFVYWPAISVVPQWFERYRGVATGLAVLGAGLGNIASGILVEDLITNHGTAYTVRVLSGYCLGILLVATACLERRLPPVAKAGIRNVFSANKDITSTRNFKLTVVCAFFFQIGYNIPFATLAAFVEDQGLTTDDAALAVGAVGIGSAIGRVAIGFSADCLGRVRTFKVVMMATAITCGVWYFATTKPTVTAFAVAFGFFSGGFISLVPVVLAEWYGTARLGSIMGLVSLSLIPGSFIGPLVSGFLYDQTNSYLATCLFTTATVGLSALTILFVASGPQLKEDL